MPCFRLCRAAVLAALAAAAAAVAPASRAGWLLEHDENFATAGRLDTGYWTIETGFQRNHEAQYYTPGNLTLENGALTFEARRESRPNAAYRPASRDWRAAQRNVQYTSASIVSRRELLYGRIEVTARSPTGAGVWPAIWLLHEGEREYGEIDLFEAVGKHPDTAFAAVHYGRDAPSRQHRGASQLLPGFDGRWHTHTLEWTPERIVMFLDGRELFAFDPRTPVAPGFDPLRRPMRLHLNLALGGSWGGPIDDSRLPARFQVSAIKVWHWQPDEAVVLAPAVAVNPVPRAEPVPPQDAGATVRWGR